MANVHPFKDLIDAITSGAPAERRAAPDDWRECDTVFALWHGTNYGWDSVRLKSVETHREKTVRYPVPMQVMPTKGTKYWLIVLDKPYKQNWDHDKIDLAYFNAGLCYESHREAEAREAWEARFGEGWK